MRNKTLGAIYGAAAAVLVTLLLFATFWFMGSAIVLDRSGNVMSAAAINGHSIQELYDLPGRIFYIVPHIDGVIEIRCRDGSRKQNGYYVTRRHHTWLRIEPGDRCAEITQLRRDFNL